MEKYDVVVIGAGVCGSAIARELSRYKVKTALLDKEPDVSFGTSKANSGIIHGGFHSTPGTLKASLCVKGNRMFDRLAEELDFPFIRKGALVVAFNYEEVQYLQSLYKQGKDNNVPYLELLGKARTLEIEPELNKDVEGALYSPSVGIIGPYEFCFALAENAQDNGVDLLTEHSVSWIRGNQGNFTISTAEGANIGAKYIINAAGLFADQIANMVGLNDFKINPRKGEEYLLDKRVGEMVKHVIFPVPTQKSKGMLIIPTVDGPVMVGPTAVDIESRDDFATTRAGLAEVFQHGQKLMPGIRTSDIITSFVGLRPAATGGDFIIGETSVPGFINAAGIQSPGLTASPAIAEMVVECLLQQGLVLQAKPNFKAGRKAPERASRLISQGKLARLAELIKENPSYANLVCRCEQVTEAEIVDAIHHGHTTLDSLKFRSRAMSGRCQGGFCTHRILQILSRETGLPINQLTKKGKGSEIVLYTTGKGESNA